MDISSNTMMKCSTKKKKKNELPTGIEPKTYSPVARVSNRYWKGRGLDVWLHWVRLFFRALHHHVLHMSISLFFGCLVGSKCFSNSN